jgi:hypothetical protein
MSDTQQGPNWWKASDGKWYPPESHPDYRPPPPPSGGRRRKEKRGTSVWKLALGVCLGLMLFLVVCSALISSGVKKITDTKEATVRIEAPAGLCWSGSIGDATQEGCGDASFPVRTAAGNLVSANVQKKSAAAGTLTIVIEIGGVEKARNSTSAAYGLAQATSAL